MKSDKIRSLEERVRESAVFLYSKGVLKPEIGIILGSGLNDFADRIENPLIISYNDVPLNAVVLGGLTTISTDFAKMGKLAAEMILSGKMTKIHNDFRMIRRKTF